MAGKTLTKRSRLAPLFRRVKYKLTVINYSNLDYNSGVLEKKAFDPKIA